MALKFVQIVILLILVIPGLGQVPFDIGKMVSKEKEILKTPLDTGLLIQTLSDWKQNFNSRFPDLKGVSIDDISNFIISDLGIIAARDSLRLSNLVFDQKGNCVTIATLYYILAVGTSLDIKVVHVPQHFFIRTYFASGDYINTEPTQQGGHLPDSFYIVSKNITAESIRKGSYMVVAELPFLLDAYNNNLAVLLQARGDYQKAIDIYSSSLRTYPTNAEILVNRGDCYRNTESYENAISDYTEAIRLYDQDPGYFERRGKAYVNAGKCKEAIADFTTIIENFNPTAAVLVLRGKAYINCNQPKAACLDWEAAIKTDDPEALKLYSRHCSK